MKRFKLIRCEDSTTRAEGVIFSSGTVSMRWLNPDGLFNIECHSIDAVTNAFCKGTLMLYLID